MSESGSKLCWNQTRDDTLIENIVPPYSNVFEMIIQLYNSQYARSAYLRLSAFISDEGAEKQ